MPDTVSTSDNSSSYLTPYLQGLFDIKQKERAVEYLTRVKSLPAPVQSILKNFSTAQWIEDKLGGDFVLSPGQKVGIRRIICVTLLGDLYMGDIAAVLQNEYQVDPHMAQEIYQRIVYQLFTPAVEDIKKIQREKFATRLNPATPPKIQRVEGLYQQTTPGATAQPPQPSAYRPAALPPKTFVMPPGTPTVNPENIVDLRNK